MVGYWLFLAILADCGGMLSHDYKHHEHTFTYNESHKTPCTDVVVDACRKMKENMRK